MPKRKRTGDPLDPEFVGPLTPKQQRIQKALLLQRDRFKPAKRTPAKKKKGPKTNPALLPGILRRLAGK